LSYVQHQEDVQGRGGESGQLYRLFGGARAVTLACAVALTPKREVGGGGVGGKKSSVILGAVTASTQCVEFYVSNNGPFIIRCHFLCCFYQLQKGRRVKKTEWRKVIYSHGRKMLINVYI
jgi:hypothetical protein